MINQKIDTFLNLKEVFKSENFSKVIKIACRENSWFTEQMIRFAVTSICENMLNRDKIELWLKKYDIPNNKSKRVGIICAGNIPLVGFFDLLCACMVNHNVTLKPSSKDRVLMEFICDHLDADIDIVNNIDRYDIDLLIATGGNQAAEDIALQYKGIPSIIRHNRKSVAILSGFETNEQLRNLSNDIFLYFGLGCRNVSHIFVPKDYNFERLIDLLKPFPSDVFMQKIAYEKAMAIMKKQLFIQGQNIILIEQEYTQNTPIGTISYSFYNQEPILDLTKIQCTIGFEQSNINVNFGETQNPNLNQYPDNVDVINFLISN